MNKLSSCASVSGLLINKQKEDALSQLNESNVTVSGVITREYSEWVSFNEALSSKLSGDLYYFTKEGLGELNKKSLGERSIEVERLIYFLECRKDIKCECQVSDSLEAKGDVELGYWFTRKGSRDFFFLDKDVQCVILNQLSKYFNLIKN